MAQSIIYRIEIRAKQPLARDEEDAAEHGWDCPTLEYAGTSEAKRNIEKAVIACLRRFELDCDVELMDFTVEDE